MENTYRFIKIIDLFNINKKYGYEFPISGDTPPRTQALNTLGKRP